MIQTVLKRDGRIVGFNEEKIVTAIRKAMLHTDKGEDMQLIRQITDHISFKGDAQMTVEAIQDLVEMELMKSSRKDVAQKYIAYRNQRSIARKAKTRDMFLEIINIKSNDITRENANMNADTPAGMMMKFASETTKPFVDDYLLSEEVLDAVSQNYLHIHDKDYYPTKSLTCVQHPLDRILTYGFSAGHGESRPAKRIETASILGCISLETAQNEMHGGQAIPAFDFYLAPYVRNSFIEEVKNLEELNGEDYSHLYRKELTDYLQQPLDGLTGEQRIIQHAVNKTVARVHQSMEAFIHNMNTIHSRGGNQVVFSSINYGTDTSAEGRMVIEELLKATIEGLGTRGEVPVFPIQIFKVKDGVSYSEKDFEKAMKAENIEAAMTDRYEAPNFDLLLKACQTTAKALFPNFMFLDAPFNQNEKWRADDPKRYIYELATMGCRTRVFENVAGEKSSLGRGNLSFTTLNMPRLAIEASIKAENLIEDERNKDAIEQKAKEIFIESVHQMSALVADQLYERYQYQRTALARQFPFMMGNNVWKGGGELNPNEQVGDALRSGTLGIGFIGGHNAMVALYGQGHGHNQKAWDTLYEAVMEMNKVVNEYKEKYNLNYSVLATPAEGLSGRFTKMDRRKYGKIPGVTDRDYYVNSFHVDVKEPISIVEKIKREAPFHAITRGGHITYVELDGEAQKNVRAIAKIVKVMHDEGIGYGSINHPVDTCHNCGYKGVIFDKCPVCQSESILRMRRITGYLTGDLSSWNSAKRAEEQDRVKHL